MHVRAFIKRDELARARSLNQTLFITNTVSAEDALNLSKSKGRTWTKEVHPLSLLLRGPFTMKVQNPTRLRPYISLRAPTYQQGQVKC